MSQRTMIQTGRSLSMRTGTYEAKVRAALNDGPLSKQEREWCQHHYDEGDSPEKVANALRVIRKIEANKRAMAEARELEARGVES